MKQVVYALKIFLFMHLALGGSYLITKSLVSLIINAAALIVFCITWKENDSNKQIF